MSLKHRWLFLNTLDSAEAVRRLAAFYIQDVRDVVTRSTVTNPFSSELSL